MIIISQLSCKCNATLVVCPTPPLKFKQFSLLKGQNVGCVFICYLLYSIIYYHIFFYLFYFIFQTKYNLSSASSSFNGTIKTLSNQNACWDWMLKSHDNQLSRGVVLWVGLDWETGDEFRCHQHDTSSVAYSDSLGVLAFSHKPLL